MKIIILDDETTRVMSLVFMQSEGFKKDVYLCENIKNCEGNKLPSFIGIFIVRGTDKNIIMLRKMLKEPYFKEYHIFFTTSVDETTIKMMAEADCCNVLKN